MECKLCVLSIVFVLKPKTTALERHFEGKREWAKFFWKVWRFSRSLSSTSTWLSLVVTRSALMPTEVIAGAHRRYEGHEP